GSRRNDPLRMSRGGMDGDGRGLGRRQRIRFVLLGGLLLGGALVWHHQARPYHFEAVAEGVLYRSGTLGASGLAGVLERYRVRTVVNLRSEAESAGDWHREEARVCADHGVALVDMPMRPETPPTPEQVATWLRLLDDPEAQPILVHCEHGVVRTGMMVAVYEMEYRRRAGGDVLATLPMFGHELYVPRRARMREFIAGYVPRWRRDPGR
ncbi:MAG: tyrosine-protein phosphatase, partial [Planctomycetota bacterium]